LNGLCICPGIVVPRSHKGAAGVFGREKSEAKEAVVNLNALHAKIGELTRENDLYERSGVKRRHMLLLSRRQGGL
jgi:hypothetical protein